MMLLSMDGGHLGGLHVQGGSWPGPVFMLLSLRISPLLLVLHLHSSSFACLGAQAALRRMFALRCAVREHGMACSTAALSCMQVGVLSEHGMLFVAVAVIQY
jgi:hypothetical protein